MNEQDYLDVILAFDYGDVRIGVAIKPAEEYTPQPLLTIQNNHILWPTLKDLMGLHQPALIVVGRPRNLEGEDTAQTIKAQQFADKLADSYNIKVILQDEALTTQTAQARLPKKLAHQSRQLIDQYAACIILEDYLRDHQD